MAAHSAASCPSACPHPIVIIPHRSTSILDGDLDSESPPAASQHEPRQQSTPSFSIENAIRDHIFREALNEYATLGARVQANIKLRSFVDTGLPIEGLAAEYFHKVLRDDTKRRGRHVVSFPRRDDRPATEEEKKDKLRKVPRRVGLQSPASL